MQVFDWIEINPVGEWVRSTVLTFYYLEMVHVIGIVLLFGSLAIMDLRLVGVILKSVPAEDVTGRLRPATWIGFALAAATGTMMFLSAVAIYVATPQFWLKMGVIAFAGINMIVFELLISKRANQLGEPGLLRWQRFAGLTSILAWCLVIGLGRWIGFTKGLPMDLPADFVLPPL
jgi:hypothetical protein